ncbi:hypothetical protein [Methanococcoides seepicolus]|uniref:Uncharacterized protein n=1 Tax=Methanococcoides seepicolus TaxID=2828780 RepID=A0A9E5DB17_9EURY|nr:hypothetical protein [Methanococcoides seepicolus]MCM1986606.1 hypothetical protein [Methanococcoides seepicolus]
MDDIFGEVVYTYTSEQAVEDGILFDILQVNPEWEKGIFRFITTNLMAQGYLQDDGINVPNLLDLLNQANSIVRNASNGFKDKAESFYSGKVELPSGKKQQIFISLNELGKYTIMLPEDY